MDLKTPQISGNAKLKIYNDIDKLPANRLNDLEFRIEFTRLGLDNAIRNLNNFIAPFNYLDVLARKINES